MTDPALQKKLDEIAVILDAKYTELRNILTNGDFRNDENPEYKDAVKDFSFQLKRSFQLKGYWYS